MRCKYDRVGEWTLDTVRNLDIATIEAALEPTMQVCWASFSLLSHLELQGEVDGDWYTVSRNDNVLFKIKTDTGVSVKFHA